METFGVIVSLLLSLAIMGYGGILFLAAGWNGSKSVYAAALAIIISGLGAFYSIWSTYVHIAIGS